MFRCFHTIHKKFASTDTTSQMVLLPNDPDKSWPSGMVLVIAEKTRLTTATIPLETGDRINPKMVATKIANVCHAWMVSPAGTGKNHNKHKTPTISKEWIVRLDIFIFLLLRIIVLEPPNNPFSRLEMTVRGNRLPFWSGYQYFKFVLHIQL